MSEVVTLIPLAIIAVIAVFLAWILRGKEVPDRAVGIAAPIAGLILLYVLSDSALGIGFALCLIGIGGVAWYRHWRDRARPESQDHPI